MKIGTTIYLDHQATTPVDPRVFEKMKPCFCSEFGNPHSSEHVLGWRAEKKIQEARESIAHLIGADADEIIFTSGATEANNLGLLGLCKKRDSNKRRVLVSAIEHKSVFEVAKIIHENYGLELEIIPVTENGLVDVEFIDRKIDNDVLFVAVMVVNNEVGVIQPINKIAEITSREGVPLYCDASQAPCSLNIDVFNDKIDLLSLSGHKMYGPQGVGALYIRRDLQGQIAPLFYGGSQQSGIRPGTVPVPLCVGIGAAAELLKGSSAEEDRIRLSQLRNKFGEALQASKWDISLNGPSFYERHPGNLNVCFKGFVAQDILAVLQPRLAASTGSACTSGIPGASYVLRSIGLTEDEANASVRFSLGRFTTEEDIEEAIILIFEALSSLD